MSLLQSRTPTMKLGSRYAPNLVEVFAQNFTAAMADDAEIQKYTTYFKQDLSVKLVSGAMRGAGYYAETGLKMTNTFFNLFTYPITYPLSKFSHPPEYKLTPCPFPPAKMPPLHGKGYLALRKNTIYEQMQLNLKNLIYKAELSKNICLKFLFSAADKITSLKDRLSSFLLSKSQLVYLTIQNYFPTFDEGQFVEWLESSFLPCLTHYYLRGLITPLKTVASTSVVQERQMQISSYVISGLFVRSRLLSLYDVEIVDFDFKGHLPIVNVRYSIDYIDHVINRKGKTVIGGPECVKKTDVLVLFTINDSGPEPFWTAHEVHLDQSYDKI